MIKESRKSTEWKGKDDSTVLSRVAFMEFSITVNSGQSYCIKTQ